VEATEILKEEHQAIKRVLAVLQQAARDISNGKQHAPEVFEQAVDFIRNFADKCHHMKEEDILFKEMEKKGIPVQGGPIGVMLLEHEKGRVLVRAMAEAIPGYAQGVAQARMALADHLRGYANLLAQHIDKEDNILYPMANQRLNPQEQASLRARFEQVEKEEMGPAVHEHYHDLVANLEILVLGHTHEETHHHHP
jgi:hemerythrin-like domain-containing protein